MSESPTPVTAAELTAGGWPARMAALDRLPAGEPVAAELHAALVGLLSAPAADDRAKAVAAVARAGAPLVPLLVALLEGDSPDDARRAAVVALGRIGPPARGAVPLLCELAADEWLGPPARAALAAIEPPRAGRFVPLCAAAAAVAVATVVVLSAGSVGSGTAVLGVIAASVALGIWWTRPGAAGAVLVFAVGVAIAIDALAAGAAPGVFDAVARALRRP